AVAPALRQAVVEPALLEHGIGEPDPAAHHDDEEKQQERVGDPAIARGLHVFVASRRFRLVHAFIVTRGGARRNGRVPEAARRDGLERRALAPRRAAPPPSPPPRRLPPPHLPP